MNDPSMMPTPVHQVRRSRSQLTNGTWVLVADGNKALLPQGNRSALDETDWHRLEETRFADSLAEMLYDRAHRDGFRRPIVATSPRVLGELRKVMHKAVADRIVGEMPKTLTYEPVDEIARHVSDALTPQED
jgi:protein required for attachment to host cells